MKNAVKLLALSVFTTLFVGCVNNDEYNNPDLSGDCATLTATKQVVDITSTSLLYPLYKKYEGEDIIEAYVTSSDEGGNFYKSISFVSLDETIGFSMPIDDYNLYTKFPPGTKVFINMKDRYYTKDMGATIIGSLYNSETPADPSDDKVGRISIINYRDIIKKACTGSVNEDDLVTKVTIQQAKSDTYLNKLIEIDNVQFTDASVGKKYYDESVNSVGGATNHLITDICGTTTLTVRVSEFATFASERIPNRRGTIRGVMTKFGTTYQFMIRTLSDVKLDTDKPAPIFEETFTSNFPNWVVKSVTGAQVWTLNTSGNPGNCVDMNGYSGSAQNNEDWLISPVVDLTGVSCASLTFQSAKSFTGNALQVYVSTNYNGTGAPSTATWTQLTATVATLSNFVWTNSNNISLTPYLGNPNVRIAFKYTSTTSGAAQWRVDNVKIQ
jgi:hypothetical protein